IQQKCLKLIGENIVNSKYNSFIKEREKAFRQRFKDNGTEKQLKITAPFSTVPFNGFSYFKVEYKGDMPSKLLEAYEKLDELNEEDPRKQYLDERKETKSTAPIPVPGKKSEKSR
ncbi:MAG: hypothetical protein JWN78_2310, partial [Bacteroidota bacterium]|nr:hypothetical protein [Bacteroidota bacterium]